MNAPAPTSPDRTQLAHVVKWIILLGAAVLAVLVYHIYETRPRTDDASVTAHVVGIAPRVSGPITRIAVTDNQYVKAGDLLFEIDPTPFRDAVDSAAAQKINAGASLKRIQSLVGAGGTTQEQVDEGIAADKSAAAALSTAQYNPRRLPGRRAVRRLHLQPQHLRGCLRARGE